MTDEGMPVGSTLTETPPSARRIKALIFDLDDTLAPSKSPVDPSMVTALVSLLQRLPVCVISGGRFEQFESQLLRRMPGPERILDRLHLMPTCGARYYVRQNGQWAQVYSVDLTPGEKTTIRQILEEASRALGYWAPEPAGEPIEDRGTQITYSALGQAAALGAKAEWDPDGSKKRSLVARVAPLLPGFEVRGGGSTSIDVTHKGIDKAYGVGRLMSALAAEREELLFVGDRLDVTGNDYPVLASGVPCISVRGWRDTLAVIAQFNLWWDGAIDSPPFSIISRPR